MSEEINDMVGDLIDQLQTTNKEANQINRVEPSVNRDNLEDYIIRKSSALIEGTIDMVDTVRDYIISAPESKDVASLAELVPAIPTNASAIHVSHGGRRSQRPIPSSTAAPTNRSSAGPIGEKSNGSNVVTNAYVITAGKCRKTTREVAAHLRATG